MQEKNNQQHYHEVAQGLLEVLIFVHEYLVDNMRASMSPNHYRTLIMLKHFGPDNMGSLAKKIAVSKQQMTPIIDRLAKDELIVRMPSEDDRRIINIALTDKGDALLNSNLDKCHALIREKLCANATEEEMRIAAERLKEGMLLIRRWLDN
ncbi:MAG: MarR family transcriptional regulator [Selenomonadales bacterium]|nr:MarR family transcriptional regulator [Selenomonadales bacterium]